MKRTGLIMLTLLGVLILVPGHVLGQDAPSGSVIRNGDFSQNLEFWSINQSCSGCSTQLITSAAPGTLALGWARTNSNGEGSALWASQPLDIDLSGVTSLTLALDVRVDGHSLSNSGWWSDENQGNGEYPVMIRLSFVDAAGQAFEWSYGFLTIHDGTTRLSNYLLVPAGVWTHITGDVLTPLVWIDGRRASLPTPARLTGFAIGGSGWDFAGAAAQISLTPGSGAGDTQPGDMPMGGTGIGAEQDGDMPMGGTGIGAEQDETQTGEGQSGGAQTQAGLLTVEEYAIVATTEDTPDHFEFKDRISPDILAVRQMWRETDPVWVAESANAVLSNFGYLLVLQPPQQDMPALYALYHGDSLLIDDISYVWRLAVNSSGTDFRLLIDPMTQPTLLVTPDTVGQLNTDTFVYIAPVYVGDDLVQIEADWNQNTFYVRRGDSIVYTVAPTEMFVEPPVKALWSYNDQWVLESEGDVIIDGQSQREQLGYEEVFGWQLINGQPFYFFKQNGQIGMSYAGQVLPYWYEEVLHYMCCEPSMFNVSGNNNMVWFYARREGMWYYVEAGVYQ